MSQLIPTKKTHSLLLYLLMLLPFLIGITYIIGFQQKAFAAITFDSSSSPNCSQDLTGPLTWSHTTGNYPNRILIVGLSTGGIGPTPTVTYKGVALTEFTSINGGNRHSLWYLKDPAPGPGNITVTIGSGVVGGAATYYNVDQTNPFGPTNKTSGSVGSGALTKSITVTNTTSNQMVVDTTGFVLYQPYTAPSTVGSGQTRQWFCHFQPGDSAYPKSLNLGSSKPADNGSTTMTWTANSNYSSRTGTWGQIAVALNPAVPLPTATPTLAPAPTATPTLPPAPTATPTPSSSGGNIINLNFGISNLQPWIQTTCGGIRIDNGLSNPVPASAQSPYTITTDATCSTPGIFVGGDSSSSNGSGNTSSTNWRAGGTLYPEVFTGKLSTSYSSLLNKAQRSHLPITDLATVCTLSSCTLPANLPHGIYQANQNLTLNSFTTPANQHYVFLVNGTTTLLGNLTVPSNASSTFLLSTTGNIVVPSSLGVPANSASSSLDGIFSTDQSMIINSSGNCTDQRLNIAGAVVTNAALTGGSFQNKRDLCAQDTTYPTVSITQRLDFLLNLPDFLRTQSMITNEVAP